jgi:hypothetical protein
MKITSNPHKPVIKEGAWSLWLSGVNNRPFLYHRCHAHHSTPNEDFGYTIFVWRIAGAVRNGNDILYCPARGKECEKVPAKLLRQGQAIEKLGDHTDEE